MSGPALRVRDLRVPFGTAGGLEPLSFDVAAGERLVLLGASGAGKTTLLRALAGLAPIAGGTIGVHERDVTRLPAERRDIVYLHQAPLLFPHLSVFENVAFPLRLRRTPGPEVQARVTQLLAAVQLAPLAARAPGTLSGGQRHRVALARAMAARPAVLLLDEPLASLDPSLRGEVRETLLALRGHSPAAMVVVTHDLEEAGVLGERIGVLLDRRLAQLSPTEDLFRRPASLAVARFLGLANELPGRVEAGVFHSALGAAPLAEPAADGPARALFGAGALRPGGPDGAPATVRSIRHRPGGATALVTVGDCRLEAAVPPGAAPRAGEVIRLTLDPRAISLFAEPGDV